MKKLSALLLAVLLVVAVAALPVLADNADATVSVTIADAEGKLVLVAEKIVVTDTDNDGALTINDALACAHTAKHPDGAAAYGSAITQYGLSLTKLWGVENAGYGYYVNNASAWSLADAVKDGDSVTAFIYTDSTNWSDTFCWFDKAEITATQGDQVTLTLTAAGYDANYAPITLPVAGAKITVNGKDTGAVTDAEGKATFTVAEAGSLLISATSETAVLVPPVCLAAVAAAAQSGDVSGTPEEEKGCGSTVTVAAVVLAVAGLAVVVRKKEND